MAGNVILTATEMKLHLGQSCGTGRYACGQTFNASVGKGLCEATVKRVRPHLYAGLPLATNPAWAARLNRLLCNDHKRDVIRAIVANQTAEPKAVFERGKCSIDGSDIQGRDKSPRPRYFPRDRSPPPNSIYFPLPQHKGSLMPTKAQPPLQRDYRTVTPIPHRSATHAAGLSFISGRLGRGDHADRRVGFGKIMHAELKDQETRS